MLAEPIDTAPRDGTHVIGLSQWGWREMWFVRDKEGDFWMDAQDSEPSPTHWIAVPDVSEDRLPTRRHKTRRHKIGPGECRTCDNNRDDRNEFHPAHDASTFCESGKRAHCSCDTCF